MSKGRTTAKETVTEHEGLLTEALSLRETWSSQYLTGQEEQGIHQKLVKIQWGNNRMPGAQGPKLLEPSVVHLRG